MCGSGQVLASAKVRHAPKAQLQNRNEFTDGRGGHRIQDGQQVLTVASRAGMA
ncbi:hypothetical protein PC129_g3035 [Phytophthora cactorum]|uniref:Uncharacterized protein n=1 Tax=Phytophthora cactorum TaxID=29920 RepID=A0A8T1CUA1_9STRA|nr:hypothetical protein Pcac1_g493 [Phytophthora cactorum]KAG2814955.1 hypothetical protein PC112_g14102 [Phytophthora cactorum]KAG2894443.1 hypothetical protein PC114_g15903 [Phytophthora cactorum]KAG2907250.1 hypothetical protein PC115_g14013 [Phytophthora cactorum]KAG2927932.1 hypothetical protein PC117_g14466 [Phytophthora cactorum]